MRLSFENFLLEEELDKVQTKLNAVEQAPSRPDVLEKGKLEKQLQMKDAELASARNWKD